MLKMNFGDALGQRALNLMPLEESLQLHAYIVFLSSRVDGDMHVDMSCGLLITCN